MTISDLSAITVYPLCWPPGYPRTASPERRKPGRNKPDGFSSLEAELDQWGIVSEADYVVSSNLHPLRPMRAPIDPGISMWFKMPAGHSIEPGSILVFASDRFQCPQENMQAIAHTMERLRKVPEAGVYTLAQAVLGAVVFTPPFDWRREMGFQNGDVLDRARVDTKFRELAKSRHPDTGGSEEQFKRLVRAKGEADRELQTIEAR